KARTSQTTRRIDSSCWSFLADARPRRASRLVALIATRVPSRAMRLFRVCAGLATRASNGWRGPERENARSCATTFGAKESRLLQGRGRIERAAKSGLLRTARGDRAEAIRPSPVDDFLVEASPFDDDVVRSGSIGGRRHDAARAGRGAVK